MLPNLPVADREVGNQGPRSSNDGAIDLLLAPELDVVFWPSSRAGAVSAWWGHVPFAHWLTKSARPRTIVELGTHAGVSYGAFCEAVLRERLEAQCFAVDTWVGDEHAGQYDERVFEELNSVNTARYSSFSRLIRSTFDDALQYFADGSIDLLHIDGLHTYEAVKHDFQTWLPKMSKRGVVLFHDINVRERGFGVWRLWEELNKEYVGFEFYHCHGLGVLVVGTEPPEQVVELVRLSAQDSAKVRERFSELGARWVEAYAARQAMEHRRSLELALHEETNHKNALSREVSELRSESAELRSESAELRSESAELRGALAQLKTTVSEVALASAAQLSAAASQHSARVAKLKREINRVSKRELLARKTLSEFQRSTMWRTISPLRGALQKLPLPLRATLRRGAKAVWWALTPHRIPARIDFLRSRKQISIQSSQPQSSSYKKKTANASRSQEQRTSDINAHYRVDRIANITGQDVVVLVCYCPSGRLTQLQRQLVHEYNDAGYLVALVVNSGCFGSHRDPGASPAAIQIVRENLGYDFGAWSHAVRLIGGVGTARSITFTNDSVIAPRGGILQLRRKVDEAAADVVFATENLEHRHHLQSYFFCIKNPSTSSAAFKILTSVPCYADKQRLINEVELTLSERLVAAGLQVKAIYDCEEAAKIRRNPTIYNWRALIRDGYPFLKVQLFTLGLVNVSDPDVRDFLGDEITAMLGEHVRERSASTEPAGGDPNTPAQPALATTALYNEYGAQQAFNPPSSRYPALVLPFSGDMSGEVRDPKVVGIIHCFYPEVAEEILREIANLDLQLNLVLTTDTESKQRDLERLLQELHLSGKAVVCPNRGRDVAPFIIEGKNFVDDAELVFHLHTKKSPHDSRYADWGSYVRDNLLGSREIVRSIWALFDDPRVGIVYSDHHKEVVGLRNWGYDFGKARSLLQRVGITLSADDLLEFPTSTMFWARKDAIDPLFQLGLAYDDFDEELGQVDGTLAHAIERSLLFLAESRGYTHVGVVATNRSAQATGALMHLDVAEIGYHINRRASRILGTSGRRSAIFQSVTEVYPVTAARSDGVKPRLNLLLPTAKPEKIYGGVSSALRCAADIMACTSDVDLRIVITSDPVDTDSLDALSSFLQKSCVLVQPDDDVGDVSVVSMAERQFTPLTVRSGDVFLATAWWTADLGFRLLRNQRTMFRTNQKMLYLIQDYEPGFYPWSARQALADATYRNSADTIALINSEELADFMGKRFSFAETYVLPFTMNEKIQLKLRPTKKEKIVLAYGRPSVERNAFAIVREALRQWQAHNPEENTQYKIVFAGEGFSPDMVSELENVSVEGKLSLDDYAELLNRSAIGLSLMISPHPSYPPLEMASAGCVTITNRYASKDLSKRSDKFISLDEVTPEAVARALEDAKNRIDLVGVTACATVASLECRYPILDYDAIAQSVFPDGRR
ncbi:class I SAM-dependent methyltransferase [Microvirga sp. HBU67558]|uniref:rhamnosyltransferase WsaF family glycosyltransferase n=1 Tax=Microvirga TaxID=186650 RepID=UPI001B380F4A|nr:MULTISPECIES: rhamnan synthesis F family protein [unclassified Microvirga]MBQ0823546.1 class I SAM-dependent methyltransferase [Microvirga sp. HBU67558]